MKNISKLAILILLFNCIMCLSAKAQDAYDPEASQAWTERMLQRKEQERKKKEKERQEQLEIEKRKKEYIQMGLIIGGIFAIPMLIVSTTLIISTIKEKRHESR